MIVWVSSRYIGFLLHSKRHANRLIATSVCVCVWGSKNPNCGLLWQTLVILPGVANVTLVRISGMEPQRNKVLGLRLKKGPADHNSVMVAGKGNVIPFVVQRCL